VATLLALGLLALVIPPALRWALVDATWAPATPERCLQAGGACWAFLQAKLRLILFGRFPPDESWRPALATLLLLAAFGLSGTWRLWRRPRWRIEISMVWVVTVAAWFSLMGGGAAGLVNVDSERWGGLPLTLMLASLGIAVAFLLGVLLALGRRSTLPVVRALSIAYIEVVRGVPLVSILFMAAVTWPILMPGDVSVSKLARAQAAFSLFFAAYLAEVVRGGLQAVPAGQAEAAEALGLGRWQSMILVVLPQALRTTLPSLVNVAISAFKDTSLVVVIGMHDLLGTTTAAINDPAWMGFYLEAYLFTGSLYLAFCGLISWYSQRLERHLRAGA
jgi:general L-amino acid transport system permease protein